MFAGNIYNIRN